jgi:hypothetical protein
MRNHYSMIDAMSFLSIRRLQFPFLRGVMSFLALPGRPISEHHCPLRSVASAVSLIHVEHFKIFLSVCPKSFLIHPTCHAAYGLVTVLNNHFLRDPFHDVEVEEEAALEALRTFCRNTEIDKTLAMFPFQHDV